MDAREKARAACNEAGPEKTLHYILRWCEGNGRLDISRRLERIAAELREQGRRRAS